VQAERARARYTRAVELDPALAAPHRQLGLLHYELKEVAQARAEFERYLALAPGAPDAARIAEYVRELGR
jgi:regulator of sirC expression with transglutaminase-like and TPR domain